MHTKYVANLSLVVRLALSLPLLVDASSARASIILETFLEYEAYIFVGITDSGSYTIPDPPVEGEPYAEVYNYTPEFDDVLIYSDVVYDDETEYVEYTTTYSSGLVEYPEREEYYFAGNGNLVDHVVIIGEDLEYQYHTTASVQSYDSIPPEPSAAVLAMLGVLCAFCGTRTRR